MSEPALFTTEDSIRTNCEIYCVDSWESNGCTSPHFNSDWGDMHYIQSKDGSCVVGEFLKIADIEGFIGWCEIECSGQNNVVIQNNKCLGVLFFFIT